MLIFLSSHANIVIDMVADEHKPTERKAHIHTSTQTVLLILMGRINIVLSDETERRLRKAIVDAYGGKKGDMSHAIERAIVEWLGKNEIRKTYR